MELFSLLAKLTLDKKEFDKAISEAENDARGITVEEPELGLDDEEFYTKVSEAENTDVDDPDDPKLGLDTDEFHSKVDEAEDDGQRFAGSLGAIFSELKGVLVTSGIVAAVSGIVGTLKEGVELAKNHGDQIDKQSQKMGISAKAYQEWAYALNLSGASIDDLNRGLRTWQQSIGDEDATAKLASAFTDLGMDAEKAIKQLEKGENLDNVLDQVLYGLADYKGSDRGAIVEALFGKNSTALNALLNSTSAEIRDMKQEAEDLGMVMTDEEVKNAAAYMDATSRLDGAIKGLKEALVADLLPFLTEATNMLANLVSMFNPRNSKPTLVSQFEEIDKSLGQTVTNLEQNEAKADSLLNKLIALGEYNKLDEAGKKTWDEIANELIKIFPELDKVIDQDTHTINGNTEEIRANIAEWTKLEQQRAIDESLAEKRKNIAQQYADALDKEIEAELKEADADGKRATAMERLNELLQSTDAQYSKMQKQFHEKYGEGGVTAENFASVQEWFRQNYSPLDMTAVSQMREWESINNEAESLRQEAEQMSQEADEASESYRQYADKLAEKLGITISETDTATEATERYRQAILQIPSDVWTVVHQQFVTEGASRAIGDHYVPYDNFPALLHRGERVLTATEARRSSNADIDYTRLEDKIVEAIRVGMADANVTAVVTDRQVAKGSNRYNGNELDSRRFVP